VNGAERLLAARSLRAHRKAWAAVFAAVVVTSTLLGCLALAAGSVGIGHARVERYAAAGVVVAGDQEVSWTAKPWGGEPRTTTAGLTERVRVPSRAVEVLRAVPGVRAAVPDTAFVVREGGRALPGRSWDAARLAPYRLVSGRAPERPDEVVAGGALGRQGTVAGHRVVGVADGPDALYVTADRARTLAGHPGAVDAIGVLAAPGVTTEALHGKVRQALDRAGLVDVTAGRPLRALTGDGRGGAEHLAAGPARIELLAMLGAVSGTVLMVAVLVLSSLVAQALRQRAPELDLLHKVGATPRQVRAAVGHEVVRIAGRAAVLGALVSVPVFLALWAGLKSRGVVAEGLELPVPSWLFTASLATAGLTAGVARLVVPLATRRVEPGPGAGAGT
ncbi:FtsX-like permease family protein, partial [Streptomyces sp. NPDC048629]|uniref:FtsX-like permease family protein n=1 Tax=Streptomyces sp. NPDC048629 TaxID=3154824 RepID=UPI0034408BE9